MSSASATKGSTEPSADSDQASSALASEGVLALMLHISQRRLRQAEKRRALSEKDDAVDDSAGKLERLELWHERCELLREDLEIDRDDVCRLARAWFTFPVPPESASLNCDIFVHLICIIPFSHVIPFCSEVKQNVNFCCLLFHRRQDLSFASSWHQTLHFSVTNSFLHCPGFSAAPFDKVVRDCLASVR
jgi:hypothetical protein